MARKILKNLETSFKRLLTLDLMNMSAGKRYLLNVLRALSFAGIEFARDSVTTMAAALAYTTILSIVPVCALAVLYTKFAGKLDAYNTNLQDWILKSFVAESAHGISTYLDEFVANLSTKTLGTIGVVGLLFTAYTLLRSIEKSLNKIWKVKRHRTVWARFQMLCSMLVVIPAFFTASFYVSSKFQMANRFGSIFLLLPLFLTFLSLLFIFKFVPNTFVRWRSAILASLFSAILFETAKIAFNFYVLRLVSLSKIYGSLGLLPVFLIWIYYSWTVILLGAELCFVMENMDYLHKENLRRQDKDRSDWIHEEWGWKIAQTIAAIFKKGMGPVKLNDVCAAIPLQHHCIANHIDLLVRSGVLLETQKNESEPAYVFSIPVEQLDQKSVSNLFRAHLHLSPIA